MGGLSSKRQASTDLPSGTFHYRVDAARRSRLTDIFSAYDTDGSGTIDPAEFILLIGDAYQVCYGAELNSDALEGLCACIAERFHASDAITCDQFVNEAMREEESAFDNHPYPWGIGTGLKQALLTQADTMLQLVADRSDEKRADVFAPTYHYQPIPLQGVPCRGLEIHLNSNTCRIPDPMRACLRIPSLDRDVRVWAPRRATIATICELLVEGETWPGKRGRDYVQPRSADLRLVHRGSELQHDKTVEDVGLFFIQHQVHVRILPEDSESEGHVSSPVERSRKRSRSDNPVPETASAAAPQCFERTDSMADRHDAVSRSLIELRSEFSAAAQVYSDRLVLILDQLRDHDRMRLDPVDREGLEGVARELKTHLKAAMDLRPAVVN